MEVNFLTKDDNEAGQRDIKSPHDMLKGGLLLKEM